MSASTAGTPLLAAQALSLVRGGRELFRELSFEVHAGQLWQIEGANGAGKTSLMRILCGLSRYGFEGAVVCPVQPLYLGHQSAVKALLSPRENLSLHVSGVGSHANEEIESALARVGLCGFEDLPSHTLSAGQHRRVNLARLFLSQTPLWLLDEPFTALDKEGIDEVQTLLASHIERGGAIIITSHQALAVNCEIHSLKLNFGSNT